MSYANTRRRVRLPKYPRGGNGDGVGGGEPSPLSELSLFDTTEHFILKLVEMNHLPIFYDDRTPYTSIVMIKLPKWKLGMSIKFVVRPKFPLHYLPYWDKSGQALMTLEDGSAFNILSPLHTVFSTSCRGTIQINFRPMLEERNAKIARSRFGTNMDELKYLHGRCCLPRKRRNSDMYPPTVVKLMRYARLYMEAGNDNVELMSLVTSLHCANEVEYAVEFKKKCDMCGWIKWIFGGLFFCAFIVVLVYLFNSFPGPKLQL